MNLHDVAEKYLNCMEKSLETDGWAEKLNFAVARKEGMDDGWKMVLKNHIKKKKYLKHFKEFDWDGYNYDSHLEAKNISDYFPEFWHLRFSLCIDNAHITDNKITIIEKATVKFAMELEIRETICLKKKIKHAQEDAKQTIINCITDKLKLEKDWSDDSVLNSHIFLFWIRFSNLAELYNASDDKIQKAAERDASKIIKFCEAVQENGKEFFDCVSKCLDKYYFRGMEATIMKKMEEIESIFQNVSKQVILYGPPGAGKTYLAKQAAAHLLGLPPDAATDKNNEKYHVFKNAMFGKDNVVDDGEAKGKWAIVQFHPSYNYEDFVRGIAAHTKEKQIEYTVVDKIFAQMCKKACQDRDKATKYILVIDEINRANLAAVLGELIYAMEYRGEDVDTPYKNEKEKTSKLTIPDNLYIIGTMNTADRSIGHIDYAVRRRFAFYQLLPDSSIIRYANKDDIKDKALILFKNVEKLFGVGKNDDDNNGKNVILSQDYYREDVLPGHSYFIAENIDKLAYKFAYQVWPLLMEYFKDGVFTKNPCQKLLQNNSPSVDNLIQYVKNLSESD